MKRLSKKETRRIVDELERLRAENENLRLRRDEARQQLQRCFDRQESMDGAKQKEILFLLSDYALAVDDLPPAEKPPAWRKKTCPAFPPDRPGRIRRLQIFSTALAMVK